ncbi:MAG TPA: hypothetical protein VG099_16095, partial [Gemmataceae bacterium]|nr:hypothetical protein [Gemmataceae bacterium]
MAIAYYSSKNARHDKSQQSADTCGDGHERGNGNKPTRELNGVYHCLGPHRASEILFAQVDI